MWKPVLIAIVLGLGTLLSGCGGDLDPTLVSHKNVVYVPPASLFNCPLTALPKSFTTNAQVAQTLNTTYGNNVTCRNNMKALQSDLTNQKKVFGK
jgi:hypothetical protein